MKSWKKKQLRLSLFQVTREVILGGVGGGGGGGGRVWRLILFCFRPIVPSIVHCGSNREGSQEASREKQTIVTFCEQNIVDLQ